MQGDPRLGYGGGVTHRAKSFMAKAAAIALGGVMLAGAFVMSLAFFVVALAVVLVFGGYVWWKTRSLRQHIREQMRQHDSIHTRRADGDAASGDVIDGVVISKTETRHD
jgi:hypothetical protein